MFGRAAAGTFPHDPYEEENKLLGLKFLGFNVKFQEAAHELTKEEAEKRGFSWLYQPVKEMTDEDWGRFFEESNASFQAEVEKMMAELNVSEQDAIAHMMRGHYS